MTRRKNGKNNRYDNHKPPHDTRLLNTKEAAEYLRKTMSTMVNMRKEKIGPTPMLIGGPGQGRPTYLYPLYELEKFREDNSQPDNEFEEFYTLDDLSTRNADSPPGRFGRISRSTVLKSLTSEQQWIGVEVRKKGSRFYFNKASIKKCLLKMGIDGDKVSCYLNIQEAAQKLNTSVGNMHALRRNKKGPLYAKFGTVYVYPLEPLEQYTPEDEPIKGGFGEHGCARELDRSIDTLKKWREKGIGPKWCEINGKIYYPEDEVKRFKDDPNQKL